MAKSVINTGSVANDGTGDTLRAAGVKINDNFSEIYNALGDGSAISLTATAAELNVLDGITSTTAELNILDGVTATTAELNYVDGVTSAIQTQIDAKATGNQTVSTTSSPQFANLSLGGGEADPILSAAADADLTITTVAGETTYNFVFGSGGDLEVPNYVTFEAGSFIGDEPGAGTPVFRIDSAAGQGISLTSDIGEGNNNNNWLFGEDGVLTFPAASSIYESVGDFTIQAASNGVDSFGAVVIQTEDASGTYTTQFASTGAVRFANIINLAPLDAAPTVDAGSFAVADGTNWDPATKSGSVPYPVFYDGTSWNALY